MFVECSRIARIAKRGLVISRNKLFIKKPKVKMSAGVGEGIYCDSHSMSMHMSYVVLQKIDG